MTRPVLDIVEIGLGTAFGEGLSVTLDRLNARASPFAEHEWFLGADYEPQLVAFADPAALGRFEERVEALALAAVDDLVARFGSSPPAPPTGVVFLLPEPGGALGRERLEACAADLLGRSVPMLEERFSTRLDTPDVAILGHAGLGPVLRGLAERERLGSTLLLAADSFADRSRLNEANDDGSRLYSRETRYGFVPGEGAAAALVGPARRGSRPLLRVLGLGVGTERVPEDVDAPTLFEGLSEAALDACDAAAERLAEAGFAGRGPLLEAWYADWNNSRYRAAELAVCAQRLHSVLPEALETEHLALRLGDLGACGPLAAFGLFGEAARRLGEPTRALVTAGSWRSGLRSAIVALSSPAPRAPAKGG